MAERLSESEGLITISNLSSPSDSEPEAIVSNGRSKRKTGTEKV
jgi:hypothetical protein